MTDRAKPGLNRDQGVIFVHSASSSLLFRAQWSQGDEM